MDTVLRHNEVLPRLHKVPFAVLFLVAGPVLACLGCAGDFDTTQHVAARRTLGRELFTLLCDRVGAQALREDVTGASYRDLCRPTENGTYAGTVRQDLLPPVEIPAGDVSLSLDERRRRRARRVARIEALGRAREDLVAAFDTALPAMTMPALDGACPAGEGEGADAHRVLASTLSRFMPLYQDGTLPAVTRGASAALARAEEDPFLQEGLARLDGRRGYRPASVRQGALGAILTYPRLGPLTDDVLRLMASDADPLGGHGAGKARGPFLALLKAAGESLADVATPAPLATTVGDAPGPAPRPGFAIARDMLLQELPGRTNPGAARWMVLRDDRGAAQVALRDGRVPWPFVANAMGQPSLDASGRFLGTGPVVPPWPFPGPGAPAGPRDAAGRALGADGAPLFQYVDTERTGLGLLGDSARDLVAREGAGDLFDALGLLPALVGPRDGAIFRAEGSALVEMAYALGQIAGDQATEDLLATLQALLESRPDLVARVVGLALDLKARADAHPEAHLRPGSALWDDLLAVFAATARAPGILEDLLGAFADPRVQAIPSVFATYLEHRDQLTYPRNPADPANEAILNGPLFNRTTGRMASMASPFSTKVDRSRPDTGDNRSSFQRFVQLLHDVRGLTACSKAGAVAHINIRWPAGSPLSVPVSLDYPTGSVSKAACAFVGGGLPPDPMPACGILRIDDVGALLLDVALGRANLTIQDRCLRSLVENETLTGLVGGADAFLEETSGIRGFGVHPTVAGVSRLVFFDTPYTSPAPAFAGDGYYPKTRDFLRDVIDPIPSTSCKVVPFVDPRDGKVVQLRQCGSAKDTLRGRDPDGLFPLETMGFLDAVAPLAAAFADHDKPLLFVDLFDAVHVHWGTEATPNDLCDPSRPRSDPRWCAQDGGSTYEPLLADLLRSDLFPTLAELVGALKKVQIRKGVDGVSALANFGRLLLDADKTPGLTDRRGMTRARRNDGEDGGPLSAIYLLTDALAAVDTGFAREASPGSTQLPRQTAWRTARSRMVDSLFSVEGVGPTATFKRAGTADLLGRVVRIARTEIDARCRGQRTCPWAQQTLPRDMAESVSSPTLAATVDLVDVLREDGDARREVVALLRALLDPRAPNGARGGTLASVADAVQGNPEDEGLRALRRWAAAALLPGAGGEPSVVDATTTALTRILATSRGVPRACHEEVDPRQAVALLLQHLATPIEGTGGVTPLEVFLDAVLSVQREDPSQRGPLAAVDVGHAVAQVHGFLADRESGLEQVYAVLRQVTVVP